MSLMNSVLGLMHSEQNEQRCGNNEPVAHLNWKNLPVLYEITYIQALLDPRALDVHDNTCD